RPYAKGLRERAHKDLVPTSEAPRSPLALSQRHGERLRLKTDKSAVLLDNAAGLKLLEGGVEIVGRAPSAERGERLEICQRCFGSEQAESTKQHSCILQQCCVARLSSKDDAVEELIIRGRSNGGVLEPRSTQEVRHLRKSLGEGKQPSVILAWKVWRDTLDHAIDDALIGALEFDGIFRQAVAW